VSIKFVKILNGWVINYILTQSAALETVYMSTLALDLPRSLIDADSPRPAAMYFATEMEMRGVTLRCRFARPFNVQVCVIAAFIHYATHMLHV
jgi:hypothetical protein